MKYYLGFPIPIDLGKPSVIPLQDTLRAPPTGRESAPRVTRVCGSFARLVTRWTPLQWILNKEHLATRPINFAWPSSTKRIWAATSLSITRAATNIPSCVTPKTFARNSPDHVPKLYGCNVDTQSIINCRNRCLETDVFHRRVPTAVILEMNKE